LADVACAILPIATGGGLLVRAAMHADDAVKVVSHVDDVIKAADKAGDLTNIYKGAVKNSRSKVAVLLSFE